MQQSSKCRLCDDRDETTNHIICKCRKLAQKSIRVEMTGWARSFTGNCARNLNLTIRTNDLYTTQNLSREMRRTNSFGTLKYKRGHLISSRRPDLVIVNKEKKRENLLKLNFAVPADHRVKMKESEKKKRKINTWTLLENSKNCGTWEWRGHQL